MTIASDQRNTSLDEQSQDFFKKNKELTFAWASCSTNFIMAHSVQSLDGLHLRNWLICDKKKAALEKSAKFFLVNGCNFCRAFVSFSDSNVSSMK